MQRAIILTYSNKLVRNNCLYNTTTSSSSLWFNNNRDSSNHHHNSTYNTNSVLCFNNINNNNNNCINQKCKYSSNSNSNNNNQSINSGKQTNKTTQQQQSPQNYGYQMDSLSSLNNSSHPSFPKIPKQLFNHNNNNNQSINNINLNNSNNNNERFQPNHTEQSTIGGILDRQGGDHHHNHNIDYPTSQFGTVESRSFKVLEIDINGNPIDQIIYKNSLSIEMKLQARDIRTVDSSFPPQMPVILARDKVFILSIGFIRAIVQHNKIILFDPQNPMVRNELVPVIKECLGSQNLFFTETLTLPFEFKVLEAILIYVCKKLSSEHQRICNLIGKELDSLNVNPEHNLEPLLLYHKKGLNQFEVTVKEIVDALDQLHSADEDMALMYLSFRNVTGGTRKKNQHEELEILLENYMRQLEQISNEIIQLKETLSSTEEFVNFQLDTARNKMMRMNLMLSLVTMSAGMGSMVSGFFGMNLMNGFEHHPYSFYLVCGCIVTGGLSTFAFIKRYCQVNNILPYTKKSKFQFGQTLHDSYKNPLINSGTRASDFQSSGLQYITSSNHSTDHLLQHHHQHQHQQNHQPLHNNHTNYDVVNLNNPNIFNQQQEISGRKSNL